MTKTFEARFTQSVITDWRVTFEAPEDASHDELQALAEAVYYGDPDLAPARMREHAKRAIAREDATREGDTHAGESFFESGSWE